MCDESLTAANLSWIGFSRRDAMLKRLMFVLEEASGCRAGAADITALELRF